MKHTIRWKNNTTREVNITKSSGIKFMCLECQGHTSDPCTSPLCPLYPFKTGSYARDRKENMTDEQKAKLKERGEKMMATKNANKEKAV